MNESLPCPAWKAFQCEREQEIDAIPLTEVSFETFIHFIWNYFRDCVCRVSIAYCRNCRYANAPYTGSNGMTHIANGFSVPSPNVDKMHFRWISISDVPISLLDLPFSVHDYGPRHLRWSNHIYSLWPLIYSWISECRRNGNRLLCRVTHRICDNRSHCDVFSRISCQCLRTSHRSVHPKYCRHRCLRLRLHDVKWEEKQKIQVSIKSIPIETITSSFFLSNWNSELMAKSFSSLYSETDDECRQLCT